MTSDNATTGLRDNATTGLRANQAALKVLIERHKDEFAVILGDEREQRGLTRDRGPDPRTKLRNKIAAQERRLNQLREELEKLN